MSENTPDLHKRWGRINITEYFFDDAKEKTLKELFSNFFVFRTNIDIINPNVINYYGVSPLFRVLEKTDDLPYYEPVFNVDENGNHHLTEFKEIIE